ncbi:MAG: UDP-N-acetylmuramate dehydrogenase [Clostridia bacterium]|nr:UDP-N-acetylmuramate dehydrogenase [Clostridia bacterium]
MKIANIDFEENVSGARLCSFRVGGNVRVVAKPKTADQLTSLYDYLYENEIKNILLGRGSNVVISDDGFDGVVVSLSELSSVDIDITNDRYIIAGAGASMAVLANFAYENGLAGLEFAHGIPGSVGGGVYMNAGAYGGEICQVLKSCLIFDKNQGMLLFVNGDECDFSYRHSVFMDNKDLIVLFATFELKDGDPDLIKAKMDEYKAKRIASQPLEYPSAGSTFKRPEGHFAGKLIEDCGLKGYTIGGAQVSEKHAGFVINCGGATADDIKNLVAYIQKTVKEKFDVSLECEIEFVE